MPPNNDHEQRLSTVEADVRNIAAGISEIKGMLSAQATNHIEVVKSLTLIEFQNKLFSDYQKTCDADRAGQEKRMTSVEGYQRRQMKYVGLVAGCISVIFPGIVAIFSRGGS